MAALAVGDEHPPLAEAEILEPQTEHLATTQTRPAASLGPSPDPAPCAARPSAPRPRPVPRCVAVDAPPRTNGTTPRCSRWRLRRVGSPRGTGFTVTPDVAARRPDSRYRLDTAASRRLIVAADSPAPPSEIRTTFSRTRARPLLDATNVEHVARRHLDRLLADQRRRTPSGHAHSARTVFGRARPDTNSKNSSTSS